VNIAVTVALVPALFTAGEGEEPSVTTVLISAPVTSVPPPAPTTAATAPPTTAPPTTVPPTTVATAPPRTAHTHVTAHSHPATTSTTAAPRREPATNTAAAPPEPTQAPPPGEEGNSESGRATWYELEGARAGICAHKTLPFGTIVTVTNTNTGKSIRCEVGDRGPFVDGYIIDLYRTDFEQLAPTSSGWFPAKITW
jgi:rare lipoprotein A (peptidoglycan hydrolase)